MHSSDGVCFASQSKIEPSHERGTKRWRLNNDIHPLAAGAESCATKRNAPHTASKGALSVKQILKISVNEYFLRREKDDKKHATGRVRGTIPFVAQTLEPQRGTTVQRPIRRPAPSRGRRPQVPQRLVSVIHIAVICVFLLFFIFIHFISTRILFDIFVAYTVVPRSGRVPAAAPIHLSDHYGLFCVYGHSSRRSRR